MVITRELNLIGRNMIHQIELSIMIKNWRENKLLYDGDLCEKKLRAAVYHQKEEAII